MAIARLDSPRRRPARPARWATATLLAASLVAGLVGPALAAGGGPAGPDTAGARRAAQRGDATVGRDPRTVPGVPTAADAVAATPSPAPDPTPAAAPAADPGATPTPAPAADPVPTATPVPTPTPWPTPAWPTTVTTLGASVRFYGHGYGHGVGMSQSGAKGRAAAGQSAPQILAAYFKGAKLSTVDATRVVRVLVLTAFPAPSTAPLVIVGRGGTWTVDGSGKTFPADARLRAWRTSKAVDGVATTTWHGKVLAPDGKTALWSATLKGRPIVRPLEAASSLQLASRTSSYDTYRGLFRLLLYAGSASVVNHVGLDQYLRGVVPAEMPSTWPTEALRAQVIACRSYAYNDLSATSTTFDTYDDTRSQVYRGIEGERAATDALIAAEPGAVIRYGTGVITAYYFSTGGGATENNEFAFVTSAGKPGSSKVPYLRGIVDRNQFGIPFDATATYYRWSTSALTRARLSAMFGKDSRTKVGTLTRLDLRRRGVSGRLYQVVLYGLGGTKTVSANVFRAVYNANRPAGTAMLRSNLFDTKPIP